MANYQLPNDVVRLIPIRGRDAAGDLVDLPAGTTPTLGAMTDPANFAANIVAATAPATGFMLSLNALHRTATGQTVEVDDGSLTPRVLTFDIVDDVNAVATDLDLANVTDTPQPVPAS